MKKIITFILSSLFLIHALLGQDISTMTYNIRYDSPWDSINSWNQRKDAVIKIMEDSNPSIIGVQEALIHQVKDIDTALKSYKYVGVGRDDGKEKGEFSAIFIDTIKFEILKSHTFWLSETPDKPSVGWDASMERIYTYALLKTRENNQHFWVINTHFDHIGELARQESARSILNKIRQINGKKWPVIVLGDFNFTSSEKPYQILSATLQDAYTTDANSSLINKGTFNGFKSEFEIKRIDYIFSSGFSVENYEHIYDTMTNGNYPSDHFPILVKLNFDKN